MRGFDRAVKWIMLVSGALTLTMLYAAVSKAVFVTLVLTIGRDYLGHQVGVSVAVDSVMVLLFVACLLSSARERSFA